MLKEKTTKDYLIEYNAEPDLQQLIIGQPYHGIASNIFLHYCSHS